MTRLHVLHVVAQHNFFADGTYNTAVYGEYFGLSLVLDAQQWDYLYAKSRGAGFRVLLRAPNEYPLVDVQGVRVTPGYVTSLAISATNVSDGLFTCS